MKKVILATVFGLSFSAAWAVDWKYDDDIRIINSEGTLIGIGKVDDRKLDLDLLPGYSGFVKIEVDGSTLEGMLYGDGSITLYNANGFTPLGDDLAQKGLGLEVTLEDRLDDTGPAAITITPITARNDDDWDDDRNDDRDDWNDSRDDDRNDDDRNDDHDDDDDWNDDHDDDDHDDDNDDDRDDD